MTGNAKIPEGAAPYKRTALFTNETVPAALTNDHSTKAGVWGLLHVEAGKLEFIVPSRKSRHLVQSGETHVIEPTLLHRVSLTEGTEFFVEFWR